MKNHPNLPLIVIVGETGSGKSALAIELAEQLAGEIICADSRTIYKGMDIGTAKPSPSDQAKVPHHLIDVIEPDQKFTVADFKRRALEIIKEVRSRGRLPIIVGGTGLYVDAVIFDYQFRSKYDLKIRNSLENKQTDELIDIAIKQGYGKNDLSRNRRHLIRLLESGLSTQTDRSSMIDNVIIVGLSIERKDLRANIERRVELMFRTGLRKEVDKLVDLYGWNNEALTGIGYREFEQYYQGTISMSQVKRLIVKHTIQYAKRQRSWFKRNRYINWFGVKDEAKTFIIKQIAEKKV